LPGWAHSCTRNPMHGCANLEVESIERWYGRYFGIGRTNERPGSQDPSRLDVAYHIEAALEAGTPTRLLDKHQPAALSVSLVYMANRVLLMKVRAFLDFIAPRLNVACRRGRPRARRMLSFGN